MSQTVKLKIDFFFVFFLVICFFVSKNGLDFFLDNHCYVLLCMNDFLYTYDKLLGFHLLQYQDYLNPKPNSYQYNVIV